MLYNLLYGFIISGSGEREVCFYINSNNPMNSTTNTMNSSTNTSYIDDDDDDDDVKKFTNVAKYITFYSVCFEVGLGYFTLICFMIKFAYCTRGVSCSFACGGFARNRCCLCCFHSESYLNAFSKAITPFLMIDAVLLLTIAPISNVHPFVVTCALGYFFIGLRIVSIVLTFILLFGFRYYRYNQFQFKDILSLALDFVELFLVLLSASSSLVTLINLGIPEMKSIRTSYAIATFVIVGITYIRYYITIDVIRVVTANKKTKGRKICYEVMNHLTFWIKLLFGDIVVIVLTLIIWIQHFKEDFKYAGLTLTLTVISTVFATSKYFLFSPFCQSAPLHQKIREKFCNKEKADNT